MTFFDVDFDGRLEFLVLTWVGAYSEAYISYFYDGKQEQPLYPEENGNYQFYLYLGAMEEPTAVFDRKNKKVHLKGYSGISRSWYETRSLVKCEDGKRRLLETEREEYELEWNGDSGTTFYTKYRYKCKGNKMVEVSRSTETW